jgi:EmrB/QacA subfamily drug resistance transporter
MAIVIPLSLTILTTSFPPERRGTVVGIWGGIAGIAIAAGPLVGGAVTQGLSWHWIFWVNVPIGLIAALAAGLRLAPSRGPQRPLDLPALALVAVAAVALIWALVSAADHGWGSLRTVVGLALGLAAVAGLVGWERRAPAPMLPPALWRNRGFSAATVASLLMSASLIGAVFLTAQYFQLALGFSPLAAGLRLLPWTVAPLVVAPLSGSLADRVGARRVLATGLLLHSAGLAWYAAIATVHPSYLGLVTPLVVSGIGASMTLPTAPAAALGAVRPDQIGTASGVNTTMQRIGGAFGIAVVGTVFAAYGRLGSPVSFDAGLRPGIAVAAALGLLGLVAAVAIPASRPMAVPAPAPA